MRFALSFLLLLNSAYAGLGYVAGTDTASGDSIWAFDTETNTVTAVVTYAGGVPAPGFINYLGFTPDGSQAYAGDQSGNLFAIDATTNIATIVSNGSQPPFQNIRSISFTPDGTKAYAADGGSLNVYVIDIATQTATGVVSGATFTSLSFTAISPDGTFAYATTRGGSAVVYVIDTATDMVSGSVSGSSPSFVDPEWVAFTPDGTVAYIPDDGTSNVYVVETAGHTVSGVVTMEVPSFIEPFSAIVSPDGTKAFVGDYGVTPPTVYVINTVTNEVIGTITGSSPPFSVPDQMAITQNGSTLYVADEDNPVLYVVNASTNQVTQTLTFPGGISPTPTTTEAVAIQPLSLLPPTNLTGSQKTNDFALEYEICTNLKWNASPSTLAGYNIYRNNALIARVSGSKLTYAAHNTPKHGPLVFSVTAVTAGGTESSPANLIIRP